MVAQQIDGSRDGGSLGPYGGQRELRRAADQAPDYQHGGDRSKRPAARNTRKLQ
jgi:hypothetical protein